MKGRSRLAVAGAVFALLAFPSGCRQEMYDQPKYKPLGKSDFYSDSRQARPLVDGTVARGELRADSRLYQGKSAGQLVTVFPLPVTPQLLGRGRQRFDIFCSPCHDRTGSGRGMVVRRGYRPPPSFHIDRLREAPVGHFFDVITNGLGAMPDYAAQIDVSDRWAIIAYVRALQLAQHAKLSDVPEAERARLTAPAPPATETGKIR